MTLLKLVTERRKNVSIRILRLQPTPVAVADAYRCLFEEKRCVSDTPHTPPTHIEIEPTELTLIEGGYNLYVLLKAKSDYYRQIQFQKFWESLVDSMDSLVRLEETCVKETCVDCVIQVDNVKGFQRWFKDFYGVNCVVHDAGDVLSDTVTHTCPHTRRVEHMMAGNGPFLERLKELEVEIEFAFEPSLNTQIEALHLVNKKRLCGDMGVSTDTLMSLIKRDLEMKESAQLTQHRLVESAVDENTLLSVIKSEIVLPTLLAMVSVWVCDTHPPHIHNFCRRCQI
eukprot:Blabericola_migrator_1__5483@NODE_27_length_20109_cov_273_259006_g24_i0_p7_GENE_NODE_27_length_20109_cov_273_259006_g24_i0NODE_27_length_20109_cov_273_259006_g24_i0_p7_ORF_typecomplete_len284_score76_27_NODE_27_length_20109_cov_273_259006_g24_i01332114172